MSSLLLYRIMEANPASDIQAKPQPGERQFDSQEGDISENVVDNGKVSRR